MYIRRLKSYFNYIPTRTETYDKDIILLQEVATLMDANEFLIHVLNGFGLINWIKNETKMDEFKVSIMS